jgi:hypothetical protein
MDSFTKNIVHKHRDLLKEQNTVGGDKERNQGFEGKTFSAKLYSASPRDSLRRTSN